MLDVDESLFGYLISTKSSSFWLLLSTTQINIIDESSFFPSLSKHVAVESSSFDCDLYIMSIIYFPPGFM